MSIQPVQFVKQSASLQGVTTSGTTAPPSGPASEFDKTLKLVLKGDSANKVSEEDLFSGLVQERIGKLKGQDALKKFQEVLAQSKQSMTKPDGFVPVEDATKDALRKCRDSGLLSAEETDRIYSQSFAAAQLDDNKEALYDNRGGGNDPTIAVALLEQALLSSRARVETFDAGTEAAPLRSVDEASAGKMTPKVASSPTSSEGTNAGFLYKPTADTNGKLVVLLPSYLAGQIEKVTLYDPAGKLIETGKYSGNGNGGRDHYRFTKPGSEYPDGLKIEVSLSTGKVVTYTIKESSERSENNKPDGTPSTPSSGSTPPAGTTNTPFTESDNGL